MSIMSALRKLVVFTVMWLLTFAFVVGVLGLAYLVFNMLPSWLGGAVIFSLAALIVYRLVSESWTKLFHPTKKE